jgi:hypothetical protein
LLGALGGVLAGAGRAVGAVSDGVLAVLVVLVLVVVTVVVAVPFGREPAEAVAAEAVDAEPVEESTCPFARLSVVGFASASAWPSVPGR